MSLIRKSVDTATAVKAVDAANLKAQELGIAISVAIADDSGGIKVLVRGDGARPLTVDIATNKAHTSAVSGLPTHMWHEVIKDDPPLLHGLVHTPRMIIFGGGIPILEGDMVIGAVGVSGGHYTQDMQCAEAAIAAISE